MTQLLPLRHNSIWCIQYDQSHIWVEMNKMLHRINSGVFLFLQVRIHLAGTLYSCDTSHWNNSSQVCSRLEDVSRQTLFIVFKFLSRHLREIRKISKQVILQYLIGSQLISRCLRPYSLDFWHFTPFTLTFYPFTLTFYPSSPHMSPVTLNICLSSLYMSRIHLKHFTTQAQTLYNSTITILVLDVLSCVFVIIFIPNASYSTLVSSLSAL